MKRTNLVKAFAVMAIMAAGAFFVSCANSAGGYTSKYAVGDIVLNDGTKVSYDVAKDYSDEELTVMKSKAIAVIFKADTENKKALGVGLIEEGGDPWCIKDALAYNINISSIQCIKDGDEGNYTFSVDTDGSDNFEQIKEKLEKTYPSSDTDDESRYKAFYFAINYKNAVGSNVKNSVYEDGWYLPTLAELYDIYKEKTTVNGAITVCDKNQLGDSWYWSSSQHSYDEYACSFNFATGAFYENTKNHPNNVSIAIRAFD